MLEGVDGHHTTFTQCVRNVRDAHPTDDVGSLFVFFLQHFHPCHGRKKLLCHNFKHHETLKLPNKTQNLSFFKVSGS